MYILILIIIAAIANAIMDRIKNQGTFANSMFSRIKSVKVKRWFDERNSWRNKWKLDTNGKIIKNDKKPTYYLGLYSPKYVESFPYSSTILVGLTDAWHFFQRVMLVCMFSAIPLYAIFITNDIGMWHYTKNIYINIMIDFAIISVVFRLVFSLFYDSIFVVHDE